MVFRSWIPGKHQLWDWCRPAHRLIEIEGRTQEGRGPAWTIGEPWELGPETEGTVSRDRNLRQQLDRLQTLMA